MISAKPVSMDEVQSARERLQYDILRTPLVRLKGNFGNKQIYLKLENLQPIGSFKLRGAGNAIQSLDKKMLKKGIWTASAGNMAQGVAWYAKSLGIKCTIIVPVTAPKTKLDAITSLGASFIKVPFLEWIKIMETHQSNRIEGYFIHPFNDPKVMAGNGTIALEIFEDMPGVEAIIVPYGGGGLSCGIASIVKLTNPETSVYACEPETGAPLNASFMAGQPVSFNYKSSFVDGMGSPMVFPDMWELAKDLLTGSLVVSLEQIAEAVKLLIENNKVIAEGAGAATVAAAINHEIKAKKIVCVISGGNIDNDKIIKILQGSVP